MRTRISKHGKYRIYEGVERMPSSTSVAETLLPSCSVMWASHLSNRSSALRMPMVGAFEMNTSLMTAVRGSWIMRVSPLFPSIHFCFVLLTTTPYASSQINPLSANI